MKNKKEGAEKHTSEYRVVTLHSTRFNEQVCLGSMRARYAERLMKMWSLLKGQEGEWWISISATDDKPDKAIYRAVLNEKLELYAFPVTKQAFNALHYAFNMRTVIKKNMFVPNYWHVAGRTISIYSLQLSVEACTRRHYNLITHSCSEMDVNKL
jgi:hypothetical protein